MDIRPFRTEDEEAVVSLWRRCNLVRPSNDPREDIRRKLKVRPDLFLVGVLEGKVVASLMAGHEGHRGWINYPSVDPEHQGKGSGHAIVVEAEPRLRKSGGPKVNLQVRTSNTTTIEFYRHIGRSSDDVLRLGKRLAHDDAA